MADPAQSSPPAAPQQAPMAPVTVSPPGAPQGGQQQAPAQAPPTTYDPKMVEQWRSDAGRFHANEPIIRAAQRFGIDAPEAFERVMAPHLKARELGVDPMQLIESARGNAQQPNGQQQAQPGDAPLTASALERFMADRDAKARQQQAAESAQQAERQALGSLVTKLGGDTDYGKMVARALVNEIAAEMNPTYPFGHPQYGQPRALTQPEIAEIERKVSEQITGFRGASVRQPGQQAPTTPMGQTGITGTTGTAGKQDPQANMLAGLEQIFAEQAGQGHG